MNLLKYWCKFPRMMRTISMIETFLVPIESEKLLPRRFWLGILQAHCIGVTKKKRRKWKISDPLIL